MKKQVGTGRFKVISLKNLRGALITVFTLTVVIVFSLLSGCDEKLLKTPPATEKLSTVETKDVEKSDKAENDEMRGVWVSFYELSMKDKNGGNEQEFTKKAVEMTETIQKKGLNTVFLHVRPFSDAFYESKIFPWSAYLTGEQGKAPGYDPLKIFITEAHKRNLKCHAWINPYRVSYDKNFGKLSADNPARRFREDEDKNNDSWVFTDDNGIYYNPTVPEVQKLILDGVREIVKNYDVDGIHLDDYFYPSPDESSDRAQYEVYINSGGKKNLSEWRREQVNTFISGLYSAVKAIKPEALVGISPAADIEKNENNLYADVRRWGSQRGYVDYLLPQVYFGFENQTRPFMKSVKEWSELVTCPDVKLYYGLAAYKQGERDEYAGSGAEEWIKNGDVIERQIEEIRKIPNCGGYSLYSYNAVKK